MQSPGRRQRLQTWETVLPDRRPTVKKPLHQTVYSKLRVGHAQLYLAEGVSPDWTRNLVTSVIEQRPMEIMRYMPPTGWTGETMVKVYTRRPKHGILRLLGAGRAAREGAGYMAFLERGISVPKLVLWGESRRWGLFEFGIVVTLWVDAPSIAEAYALSHQDELLFATAEELARIHQAGLAHGDPYTRNFLATLPRPMPLDLTSWSRLRKASQLKDLTRFAGSIIKLTNDPKQAEALLFHYERFGPPLPVSMNDLLHGAIACAEVKNRP